MKLRATLLMASLLVPLTVRAQPISGVYVGLGVGANFLQNEQVRLSSPPGSSVSSGEAALRFDPGFRTLASVGYGLGNGLRLEIEGDYFRNSLSSVGRTAGYPAFSRPAGLSASVQGNEEKYGGGCVTPFFDLTT